MTTINDVQTSLSEWITLIENTTTNFIKHFSNMTVLYESSDPASSIITNEALAEFKQTKSDIIKHVSGLSLLSELSTSEKLKLTFKLAQLIDSYQFPIKQMRDALDTARIKESITSSDTSHLTQTVNMLHMIFNNYISNAYKMQQNCYDTLFHVLITPDVASDITSNMLIELDKKYNATTLYCSLLGYLFKHFKNSNLIENVEVLKDRILGSVSTSSTFPFTFQTFDLVGSKYQSLDDIFEIKVGDNGFDKIAKQISIDNKQFDIIVITNPTSYIYNLWTLTQNIEYDCIDQSTIDQFETIIPVKSTVKLGVKIYKSKSKGNDVRKYYYVLETYDNKHFRVMTPWQIFPKDGLKYIPQSWLPDFENSTKHYPSGRIEAYNSIIEKKILKHKGIEKESNIKSGEVNKEKGIIIDGLKTWFLGQLKIKYPSNLSEYRELLNSDEFHDHIESIIVSIDIKGDIMTKHSVASILTRRISREILGIITKSTILKNMFEMYPDKIKTELPPIFGSQIEQCINIVVSYNTLISPILKKLELDL